MVLWRYLNGIEQGRSSYFYMLYRRVNCLFFILLVQRVNFSFVILANNAIKRKKRPYKLKIYANIKDQYFTNFTALLHQNKFNNTVTLKWGLTTISELVLKLEIRFLSPR